MKFSKWIARGQFVSDAVDTLAKMYMIKNEKGDFIGAFDKKEDAVKASAASEMFIALGKCMTALCFEMEQAQQRGDQIAGQQINDAYMHALAATRKAEGK